VKVTVTAENIEHGEPRKACACPIALAIIGHYPDYAAGLEVLGPKAYLCDVQGDPYEEAWLPDVARDFIERFDNGVPVTPIEFEMTWTEVTGP
jgi:hypothetical protein